MSFFLIIQGVYTSVCREIGTQNNRKFLTFCFYSIS